MKNKDIYEELIKRGTSHEMALATKDVIASTRERRQRHFDEIVKLNDKETNS